MNVYKLTKWQLRIKRSKSGIPHGTNSRYVICRCRCISCKKAHAKYQVKYMHSHPEQQLRHRLYMWHKNNSTKLNGILVLDPMPKEE